MKHTKWNSVYKQFECIHCDERINFHENHTCFISDLRPHAIYWNGLSDMAKQCIRDKFNNSSDYDEYDTVSEYAYCQQYG